jgi:hypothetical protein
LAPVKSKEPVALLLVVCCIASACRGSSAAKEPPVARARDVAQRFAEAIFRGKADAAVALLVHRDDGALSWLASRAAAPWEAHPADVRFPGRRTGSRWIFAYAGTRAYRDGRFEEVRGEILVVVAASPKGVGVKFFTLRNEDVRFSTHHDSLLLPSNR